MRLWRNIQNEGRKVSYSVPRTFFRLEIQGVFEKPSQDKESDFVVDYAPPEMFEAGIILQEMRTEGDTYYCVCLFCPENTFRFYGQHEIRYKKYPFGRIFVDTEEYLIKVNEKTKSFMQVRTVVGVLMQILPEGMGNV